MGGFSIAMLVHQRVTGDNIPIFRHTHITNRRCPGCCVQWIQSHHDEAISRPIELPRNGGSWEVSEQQNHPIFGDFFLKKKHVKIPPKSAEIWPTLMTCRFLNDSWPQDAGQIGDDVLGLRQDLLPGVRISFDRYSKLPAVNTTVWCLNISPLYTL